MNLTQNRFAKLMTIALISTQLQGCAAGLVAAAAGGTYLLAQDRRSTGSIVDDQSIELKARHDIGKQLTEGEQSHVNVVSFNSNVLLLGQVTTEERRMSIEDAVRNVEKVRHVHNELTVSPPISAKQRANDSWITTKIKSRMMTERELTANRVKVVTENGVVYLLGIVRSDEEEMATNIARETKGVQKVVKMFEPMAT